MIFDRTQDDVNAAIVLIKEKVQKFVQLTSDEVKTLEKGTLTINTLNRIENKQIELKSLIEEIGYWSKPIENKSWNETQIFNITELKRIIENLNVLIKAFFVYKSTPSIPAPSYYWQNINALEKILYDLESMVEDVKNHYRECGNFECGE